jgi:steroid 5-alpha reductase family enzyme
MTENVMQTRTRDLVEIFLIYAAVAALGGFIAETVSGSLIWRAGVADLLMTVAIFASSVWKKNSSTYDAYWSVMPSLLTLWLCFESDGLHWNLWQWLTIIVVNLWSWRLTLSWARGWRGWPHEDWRYLEFKQNHGNWYPLSNFFGIHLFPTIIVFVACLGLFTVAHAQTFNPLLMCLGLVIALLGTVLELVADNQLANFRKRTNPLPTDILRRGIWGVVRYPNYLGEMLFWVGVALCGLGAGGAWWVAVGAIAMVVLFAAASIPMKDKRMAAMKPDFESYRSTVPGFVPRFRRGR